MTRPLMAEEIDIVNRHSFDYNNQFLAPIGKRTGLKISRKCSFCTNTYPVSVSNIRGDLRRGRKMREGKCGECKGRIISGEGYVWINKPDHPNAYSGKYVPEHILVMEETLGRYIDGKNESVHHIDGDRANNSITNLQLRTRYHGAGQKRVCGDCGSNNILHQEL